MSRFDSQGVVGSWAVPAHGAVATKTLTKCADGSVKEEGFTAGRFWNFRRFYFSGVDALAREIAQRINDPHIALIYATLIPGLHPDGLYRRLIRDQIDATRTLTGGRRSWLAGDADKVSVPEGLDRPENWKEGAQWVVANKFPAALRNVRMAICPSSSTGRKPGKISFRWFADLSKPAELDAMHSWAVGAQRAGFAVDPAVLVPNQLIYFSRPRFIGMADPLLIAGDLVFVLEGEEDTATIDFSEYAAANIQFDATVAATLAGIGGDWRDKLEATLGGMESFHTPIKRACRGAVAAGVSEADWVQTATTAISNAVATLPMTDACERLHTYGQQELARMHRDFSRYENTVRANISALRKNLGYTGA
jgi:hypothetical protein